MCQFGIDPSSGNCGVSSPPQSRVNSEPGSSTGLRGATFSSLTNTDLPEASCPVTTRRMSIPSVKHRWGRPRGTLWRYGQQAAHSDDRGRPSRPPVGPSFRRHPGFRRRGSRIHRQAKSLRRQGRRRARRVGQRRLRLPYRGCSDDGAPQPVAAVDAGRQTGSLRGGHGGRGDGRRCQRHLSGARLRPVQHHLRRGRHRHHRDRPVGVHRGRCRGVGALPRTSRQPRGPRGDLHPQPRRPLRRRARGDLAIRRR